MDASSQGRLAVLGAGRPGLDDDALQRLGELVEQAERRQAREIAGALDAALRQVPSLLRPLLRRALGL